MRWQDRAACRDMDTRIFFPIVCPNEAQRICGRCPVRRECAEAGAHEADGVWGGVDKTTRRRR